jgi:hypothetical protein
VLLDEFLKSQWKSIHTYVKVSPVHFSAYLHAYEFVYGFNATKERKEELITQSRDLHSSGI